MDSVLKSSILIVQKLTLHQNGVEFHQQFNGAIRISVTASYDDILQRRATSLNEYESQGPAPCVFFGQNHLNNF